MVGGTTANDLATCELKVMKQRSNSKSNPKSKGFPIKGMWESAWAARWRAFPAIGICPLRAGLDSAVVVIDGMTLSSESA
jgi:hypothetical protein